MDKKLRIGILLTGAELMMGDIIDTNFAYLAKALSNIGLTPVEKVTVGDDKQRIAAALTRLSRANDIVIVNGGLGSTVDDLTAEVFADVAGKSLVENKEALDHVVGRFGAADLDNHPEFARQVRKQALMPQGAEGIHNPVGIAFGFRLKINTAVCYATPGVPREMKSMFEATILPDIKKSFAYSPPAAMVRLFITAVGESRLQYELKESIPATIWGRIELGFRAGESVVELKLTAKSPDDRELLAVTEAQIRERYGIHVFQFGDSLATEVVSLLENQGKTLAIAESCTGGRIAAAITSIPGASSVFDCGVVSYSNNAKISALSVMRESLESYGAVSAIVAEEMVRGAIRVAGSSVGIAVTGIAGPTGGTDEKPVGTVYIGWGDSMTVQTRKLLIRRERNAFQDLVTATSLDIIRRFILNQPTDVPYYYDDQTRHLLHK